jgi:hypothetical protein
MPSSSGNSLEIHLGPEESVLHCLQRVLTPCFPTVFPRGHHFDFLGQLASGQSVQRRTTTDSVARACDRLESRVPCGGTILYVGTLHQTVRSRARTPRRTREVASMLSLWIINGNLFLRLLKGVVRVRYGLRKIRACLTVSNLMVKRDDASYGIRATRTVDNATRPTSGLRRSGVAVRGRRRNGGVRPASGTFVTCYMCWFSFYAWCRSGL